MLPRLVIFDFDGTLADSFDWFVGAANAAADRFGFRTLDEAELAVLRAHGARHLMRHVGLAPVRVPQVARFLRERMAAEIDRITLVDGVERTLRALEAAGVQRAILTSNARTNVERVLGPANVARIDHWSTGASLFGKAARFRALLRSAQVAARDAVYVGDEIRDAEAARRAGLRFVGVGWGYALPVALAPWCPDGVLGHLDELLDRLSRRGGPPAAPTDGDPAFAPPTR